MCQNPSVLLCSSLVLLRLGTNLSASHPQILLSLHKASRSQCSLCVTQAFPLCIVYCIKWLLLHAVPADRGDYSALCPFGSLTPCILHHTNQPRAHANLSLLCMPTRASPSCRSRQNSPICILPALLCICIIHTRSSSFCASHACMHGCDIDCSAMRSGCARWLLSRGDLSPLGTWWVVSDLTKVLTASPLVSWQRRMRPSKRDTT